MHMVVLAKGGLIEDVRFMRVSVMPNLLTTSLWRSQFSKNSVCRGDISMQSVKSKDDPIRYRPDWAAPKKLAILRRMPRGSRG